MTFIIVFYWLVAGMVAYFIVSPQRGPNDSAVFDLILSMLVGGIAMPALLIQKVLS